ncbi:MAG TPA: hypothetical protein VFX59_26690 [Polyangiales bacterium]|nr:hypothetical protein [Polyangiales bacterium]
MQHLLDFLYEHSFDKQLFCVLPARGGELQLTWRAAAPAWTIKHANTEQQIPRTELLAHLSTRGAELDVFERELQSLVAAHIVVAEHLLRAAREALGNEGIELALHGQRELTRELREALTPLLPPRLRLVR